MTTKILGMVEAPAPTPADTAPKPQEETTPDTSAEEPLLELTAELVPEVFGFSLETVFKDGIKYYKQKERSGELQVEYPVRLRFMALAKQVKNGPFKAEESNVGWFDLVGNDANNEWKKLGDLAQEQAMLEFVRLLDVVCPTFKPHINEKAALETSKAILERQQEANAAGSSVNGGAAHYNHLINGHGENSEVLKKYEEQRRQIQEALNKATFHQFLAYAQQTHPGDALKQEQLIQQLREQHYEQYMSQVYARQAEAQAATLEGQFQPDGTGAAPQTVGVAPITVTRVTAEDDSDSEAGVKPKDQWMQKGLERPTGNGTGEGDEDEEDSDSDAVHDEVPLPSIHGQMGLFCHSNPKIAPASTWSRKDIAEFKEAIKKEGQEGIIKVGHGETVTVRVPTHEDGTCLFWEFATDYYDIGFGVYFEWSISETSEVSVHVSESSDEEYEEDAEGSGAPAPAAGDVEGGSTTRVKQRDPNKPAIDEIIPVYRRDAHEEVLAGSHVYPARGVYLLKFDNTYSLWRSKTLYYRVYYSK